MLKNVRTIFKNVVRDPVCHNCKIEMFQDFSGKWICNKCGYSTKWRYSNIVSLKTIIILIIILIFVKAFMNTVSSSHELSKLHKIILQVNHLSNECKKYGSENIAVYGKCLVWNGSYSQVNSMLPKEIRASSDDKVITIFLVLPGKDEAVGKYSISKQTAYMQYVDICAIVWPYNKPLGTYTILSKGPRTSRPVKNEPEYGNPNEPIANWIRTLKIYQ